MPDSRNNLQSTRFRIPDSPRAVQDYLWEQGWTDGLPVVAPTEPLVREMLSGYGGQPSDSLGRIQPGNSNVTLEKLAVNAVMAGCLPEHFPVVVAALKAALRDEFNLAGNVTTGGAAQVLIVNGPIAKELEINGDAACFGPGYRANAVIGRALRLAVRNLGGLIPGDMDKATLSTPYRYSFCFSENEDQSPWEPRHVELGYKPEASTVTIAAILGVYNVMESTVGTGLASDHHGQHARRGHPRLLPPGHPLPDRFGALPRTRQRDRRVGPFQGRRPGVHLRQRPDAHPPTQRPGPLRQPGLAQLDRPNKPQHSGPNLRIARRYRGSRGRRGRSPLSLDVRLGNAGVLGGDMEGGVIRS